MGKVKCLNIHLKFLFMLLIYFFNFIYFQEVSDLQIFGGFALPLLGILSYCFSRVVFKGGLICQSMSVRVPNTFYWTNRVYLYLEG